MRFEGMGEKRAFAIKLFALVGLLFIFQFFTSCGEHYVGYGVVLWDGSTLKVNTGEVFPVIQKSKKRNTYLVELPNKEKYEIPAGYIEFFPTKDEADRFVESYSPNLFRYGFAQNRGLPIREKPSTKSRIIYRLRKGQVVKIINRGDKEEDIEGYKSYWYEVLTGDGYRGYCFGYFLRVFDTKRDPVEKVKELMTEDPALSRFLGQVWRPEYFLDMIKKERIDLDKFRTDIGLFPDSSNKIINLVTDKYSLKFEYSGVEKIGNNRYLFKGTDLRVIVYSKRRITISYKIGDKNVSAVYVNIDGNLEDIISKEVSRRDNLFNEFIKNGHKLESRFYGTIVFGDDKKFVWQANDKLLGAVIPRDVTGEGIVEFKYYVSPKLKEMYDGVISLKFYRRNGELTEVDFLFKFLSGGVRFTYTKKNAIKDLEVTSVSIPPVNIFFKFIE